MTKLGLHFQQTTNWMRRVHMPSLYVKIMNPPEDNIFPDKRTIGRVYMRDGEEGSYYSRGMQGGIDYFNHCLPQYLKAPYIHAWESWNEPAMIKTPEERKAFDEATHGWTREMHLHYLRTVSGNFSERNPPDGTIGEFINTIYLTDYLGLHLYGAPMTWPIIHELRHRQLIGEIEKAGIPVPPILIGECGIDLGIVGMGRKGWQKCMSWEDYKEYLVWYSQELDKDKDIAGAFVFTAGATKGWQTFNISEKHARELANAFS